MSFGEYELVVQENDILKDFNRELEAKIVKLSKCATILYVDGCGFTEEEAKEAKAIRNEFKLDEQTETGGDRMKLSTRWWMLKDDVCRVYPERMFLKMVWLIPPKIALWCFIRVVTYSEQGCPDWYKEVHDSFMLGHRIKKM